MGSNFFSKISSSGSIYIKKNLGGSIFIMTWPRKHNYVCSEEPGTVVRRAVLLNTSRAGRCKMFHMYSIAYQSSYLLEHSGVARSWQLVGHKYRLAQINAAEVMLIQGALQHRTRVPTRSLSHQAPHSHPLYSFSPCLCGFQIFSMVKRKQIRLDTPRLATIVPRG